MVTILYSMLFTSCHPFTHKNIFLSVIFIAQRIVPNKCPISCENQCIYTVFFYSCPMDSFTYTDYFILSISGV